VPVLTSTVTAMPGVRRTVLFSTCKVSEYRGQVLHDHIISWHALIHKPSQSGSP
jgi:hypothetical protein